MGLKKGQTNNPNGRPKGIPVSESHKRKLSQKKQSHGVFAAISAFREGRDFLDLRTKAGREIHNIYLAALEEQGENPSVEEQMYANFIRSDLAILYLLNKELVAKERDLDKSQFLLNFKLRFQREARENFKELRELRKINQAGQLDYRQYVKQLEAGKHEKTDAD